MFRFEKLDAVNVRHFLFVNRLNNRDKINEDHTVCEEDRKVYLIIF